MAIKIALAGNPNSGKTTMFNVLTGSTQYVGNWPGVTVEKKEGALKKHRDVIIQDLPGIYSLSPYTPEEIVARGYLVHDKPDAILAIVDATNIERNLYLTTQLLELGIPVVVALNMIDAVKKNGDSIDSPALSAALGCPVVEISALKEVGVFEAAEMAVSLAREGKPFQPIHEFGPEVEGALGEIAAAIQDKVPAHVRRFYAIKLFERDEKVMGDIHAEGVEPIIRQTEARLDDDSESIITDERYRFITGIIAKTVHKQRHRLTATDRIDAVVTNRFLALPIFAVIMFLVYYLSISTIGGWASAWVGDVLFGEWIPGAAQGWLETANAAPWLQSLVVGGIISGIGAVLGFLPQMMVLFLLLAILEDCGYMARIAFIMDRLFRRFGLSGKSFIPMLIGTGCSVPGIMASRTIESLRDRRMTIITTSFMPCSAKLPNIALIAGAMFGGAWWVAPSAYFAGIAAIVCSGLILKKTRLFAGESAPFVMELPSYHLPAAKSVLLHMWDRAKEFIRKAGTVIFLSAALIWFLESFDFRLQMVRSASDSMLAAIGGAIAPLFAPLGWGDWQPSVAMVTGLFAKENVVSTLGVLYGTAGPALRAALTPLAAYSFLMFNLLCAPCVAAVSAIHREMGSARWTLIAVGYQTVLAYSVSLMIFQFSRVLTGGGFGPWTAVALTVLAAYGWLLFRPNPNDRRNAISQQLS